jgi:predicted phage gp36 major capsid-like protein
MHIGLRTEMNVRPLVERYADTGEIGFWAWLRMDIQLSHAKSFARILGVLRS